MHKLNILIVEDESILALNLATTLTSFGCNVVAYVTTPKKALKVFIDEEINLIIMDINLEADIDGIALYKSFKTSTKVIYITAYCDEETITRAVETEPLGYLTKPYSDAELMALIKLAKIQQPLYRSDQHILFGKGYSFNMAKNKLYYNEHFFTLGIKKLKLLRLLLEAKGSAVSFKEIEDELYPDTPPSASSIRTLIYRLRSDLKYATIENELSYGIRLVV